MIDFTTIEYCLAIWYVKGPRFDWMCAVFRERGERQWTMTYRFRYYSGSGDPFDGSDTKNWYGCKSDKPEQELLHDVDLVAGDLAGKLGVDVDRVDVRGGQAEFFAAAGGRPWLHVSRVPASG